MNFNRTSKAWIIFIGTIFLSGVMQASQALDIIENRSDRIKRVVRDLECELLTDTSRGEMYRLYTAGKLTIEDVANRVARDREIRRVFAEVSQEAEKVQQQLKNVKKALHLIV